MRSRVAPVQHRIDTTPLDPLQDLTDSSSFDTIDPRVVTQLFEANYTRCLPQLLQVVTSQLATDTALRNVEVALRAVDDELRPATSENHATIEAAHTQAFRYAVITIALRDVVPTEHLHDTVVRFMEAHTRSATGVDTNLRKILTRAVDAAVNNGVQPDPTSDATTTPHGVTAGRAVRNIPRGNPVKSRP